MNKPLRSEFSTFNEKSILDHNECIIDWDKYAMALEKYLEYIEENNILFPKDDSICIGKCEVCNSPTHGEKLCLICADLPEIDSDLPF